MSPSSDTVDFSSIPAPRKRYNPIPLILSGNVLFGRSEPPPARPKAFHRFPDLPAEIRHTIWKMVLPSEGRIVYLTKKNVRRKACLRVRSDCEVGDKEDDKKFFQGMRLIDKSIIKHPDGYDIPGRQSRPKVFGFRSNTVIPIATVCQESRAIVAQRFTLAFGSKSIPPTVWFDFTADTLYIDWGFSRHGREEWRLKKHSSWRFSRHDLSADIRKVHRLALNDGYGINTELVPYEDYPMRKANYAEWVHDVLETFGNIKRLVHADADMNYRASSSNELREIVALPGVRDIDEVIDQVQMTGSIYHPYMAVTDSDAYYDRLFNLARQMPRLGPTLEKLRNLDTIEGLADKPKYEFPESIEYCTITTKKRADQYYVADCRRLELEQSYFVNARLRVGVAVSEPFKVQLFWQLRGLVDIARDELSVEIDRNDVRELRYKWGDDYKEDDAMDWACALDPHIGVIYNCDFAHDCLVEFEIVLQSS